MSNRIRELRKKNGLTMKELGKQFGVAEGTISQYETGKRQPDIEMLMKLSQYFGVTVDYLIGGTEPEKTEQQPLSKQAQSVLAMYQQMSPDEKGMIEAVMKSIMDRKK